MVVPLSEKTNSELLREIDDALSNAIGQQDNIMSLIENTKTGDENPENEVEIEVTGGQNGMEGLTENEDLGKGSIELEEENISLENPMEKDSDGVSETNKEQSFEKNCALKDSELEEPPNEEPSVHKSSEQELSVKIEAKKSKLRSLLGNLPEIKPLSYDPSLVIDLETGDVVKKELSGPELLKEKYLKNAIVKSQVPHDTDLRIVSLENGLHVEHVMVKPDTDTFKVKKDVKPGAAYVKLKQELEKKMTESRMKNVHEREGYAKKLEEEQAQYSGDEEDTDVEEDGSVDDKIELDENPADNDDQMEVDAVEMDKDPMNEEENESNTSSDSSDEDELPDPTAVSSKKSRIIKAFIDSDEEAEEPKQVEGLNCSSNTLQETDISLSDSLPLGQVIPHDKETTLLETSVSDTSFKVPETPDSIKPSNWDTDTTEDSGPMHLLWDDPNDRCKEDELSELCSGRFGATQAPLSDLTQEPIGQQDAPSGIKTLCDKGLTQAINDEDLSDLCSGAFVTQVQDPGVKESTEKIQDQEPESLEKEKISPEKVSIGKKNVILSSDEDGEDVTVTSAKKVKKLKKKRRRQALEISGKIIKMTENFT